MPDNGAPENPFSPRHFNCNPPRNTYDGFRLQSNPETTALVHSAEPEATLGTFGISAVRFPFPRVVGVSKIQKEETVPAKHTEYLIHNIRKRIDVSNYVIFMSDLPGNVVVAQPKIRWGRYYAMEMLIWKLLKYLKRVPIVDLPCRSAQGHALPATYA